MFLRLLIYYCLRGLKLRERLTWPHSRQAPPRRRQSTIFQREPFMASIHAPMRSSVLSSSFTSSQGFLLMIPNIYKLASEYCPAVIHVAARSLSLGGMSIFNDHGDVYAARSTGIAMLASNTVQEAYDMGAIAHLTTIKTGLPFLHFFDGFRTSHEINTMSPLSDDELRPLVDMEGLFAMRRRAMNPEHPHIRGPILSEAFHWMGAEKPNAKYAQLPYTVRAMMNKYGDLTGRYYQPFDYVGAPDAKAVVVIMASGSGTIEEFVEQHPEMKIGVVKVHLYRPFVPQFLLEALPRTVEKICVMDKVREFSSTREPLATDVCTALFGKRNVELISGRYGIGSKDFNPRHAAAVFKNLLSQRPLDNFTVGLAGSEVGLPLGPKVDTLPAGTKQCLFWGLGSDGTVGANKEAVKLIVDNTDLYGQAYFAYSAHKSGGLTVSHVRFGKQPIKASYYVQAADYIACHNPAYCKKFDMIDNLKEGGVFVLNCADNADLDELMPPSMRKKLAEKKAQIYRIDASEIAKKMGMTGRINMIMQTVFFSLADVMPVDKCITLLKKSIEKQYIRKGKEVIAKNCEMVDAAQGGIRKVEYDAKKWAALTPEVIEEWKGFNKILQYSIQNRADDITVDEFTECANLPPGTAKIEKRGIALNVPKWNASKCVQCNLCSFLCPHAVIRPFLLTEDEAAGMETLQAKGKEIKNYRYRIQITPYDCTGCAVCATSCPAKALDMVEIQSQLEEQSKNWEKCLSVPNRGNLVKPTNVRNSQFLLPMFEFSGACPGCGEPAMLKLITQLYGDQMYAANAAGCSVVFSSSYPWNPYTTNEFGHGPTWGFSLFEDNAEYGFGQYQGQMARRAMAKVLIEKVLKTNIPSSLASALEKLLAVWDTDDSQEASRNVQAELAKIKNPDLLLKDLISQSDCLAKKTNWILGGDGWAYDIGYGGLDHVLASGENVNVLVLDTEVYSNTGGQCSKATQRGAVANFSAAGYEKKKKDLAAISMTYGNIYVATTCHLADPEHALKCIREAREYNGPSIVINYSPCISHGIRKGLATTMKHAKDLVKAGYLILLRYDPRRREQGKNPLQLDSKRPDFSILPLISEESRFAALQEIYPDEAAKKQPQLLEDLKSRYEYYARMAKD